MEIEAKFVSFFTAIGLFLLIPFVASTFQTTYQGPASVSPSGMLLAASGANIPSGEGSFVSSDSIPAMKKSSLGPESYETSLQTPYGMFSASISYEKSVYSLQDHEKNLVITGMAGSMTENFSTPDFSLVIDVTPGQETELFSNAYGWIKVTRQSGTEETTWYGGNFTFLSSEYSRAKSAYSSFREILFQLASGFSMPGGQYGFPSSYAASGIVINEFLANPGTDGEEWIELFNNLSASVDISGWVLDDADGGSDPYTIPANTSIPGRGFAVFFGNTTKVQLNNNGDIVRLYDRSGNLVDSVAYASSQAGVSVGRVPDGVLWYNLTGPTAGSPNTQ